LHFDNAVDPDTKNDVKILEYDESVVMFLKEAISSKDDQYDLNIDGLLRSCCKIDEKGLKNTNVYESWNLVETDPEIVDSLYSGSDIVHDANRSPRLYLTIKIDDHEQPSHLHRGVAIPLLSPSVTIRPLQSIVISIMDAEIQSTSQFGSHQTQSEENCDDRIQILRQAFWKRQLVGKVIAFADQWTSRIRLVGDIDEETDGPKDIVYAVVESCTPSTETVRSPMRSPMSSPMRSPMRSKTVRDRKGPPPLPENFFMILPSTYLTIRPAPSRESLQPAVDFDGGKNPASKIIHQPTAVVPLLMETISCIRSRSIGNSDVPRTFLLSGPPGVGKSFSVSWVANTCPDIVVHSIRGSELLHVKSSRRNSPAQALDLEFKKMVERIFLKEQKNKDASAVVGLFFLDECDALVSISSVAAMLATLLDRVSSTTTMSFSQDDLEHYWKRIIVVGATNRIDSIPSYLRRAGRFDCELPMSPPSVEERAKLLHSLLRDLQSPDSSKGTTRDLETDCKLPHIDEIQELAELCVGYVAADLSALVRKAWLLSLRENNGDGDKTVTISHLQTARDFVGASALRDAALALPPKITWDDIAGDPGGAKTALRQTIEWPRLKAREFSILGLQPCRGILLHGPPGCAKTTLARAAAGSSGVAFLSLSPAQVYASSYVGEAERVIRQAFHLARSTAPCILFFDEIDSIFGGGNSNGNDSSGLGGNGRGSSAESRVLSTFLNEMDGVDIAGAGKDGVLVLGATNRPWTLDPALLRPGRLGDKIIFLPPPDNEARRSIFVKQFKANERVDPSEKDDEMSWNLDLRILVELSAGMTGAEIVGACQEAKIHWMREIVLNTQPARAHDLNKLKFQPQDCVVDALTNVKPMLSDPEALKEFRVFENREKKKV